MNFSQTHDHIMKFFKTAYLPLFLFLMIIPASGRPDTIPTTNDPKEFSVELEQMIVNSAAEGAAILEFQSTRNDFIKNDPRDWESTLVKIIGNPEKYGPEASRISLNLARHRRKGQLSIELTQAAIRLFEFEENRAIAKYEEYIAQGKPVTHPQSLLGGFIGTYLSLQSPEFLQKVLDYFDSPEEARLELLKGGTPISVAEAIRDYGDKSHIKSSRKFALRLRNIGKEELANDIDRTITRLEQHRERSYSPDPEGKSSENSETNEETSRWSSVFWVSSIAIVLVFIFSYIKFRKIS